MGDAARTDEDDLYSIPENLRVQHSSSCIAALKCWMLRPARWLTVSSNAVQAQKSKQQDVSSWMTGIQEVALPMDFKLRNIEETEAAKKLLLSVAGASTAR